MKWRHAIVYFVALLLVGGYFYYFEVVKTERKDAAEKAAKKVFQVQTEQIRALTIAPRDKASVELVREGAWKITQPVATDVDRATVESVVGALERLEAEREVASAPEDLKPFGLQEPELRVRFQTGDQWQELLLGDKNPVGDGRYAKVADRPAVFLVAEGNWSALNKGADELRKRELFTSLKPEEVTAIQIGWQDGKHILLERKEDGSSWTASGQPEAKVKANKVENLLEQIHWQRARDFLENTPTNLETHGLKPPLVTVRMRTANHQTAELLLAEPKEKSRKVAALSSALPFVVTVDASLLQDLPKDVSAVEDRSILSTPQDQVKQLKWRLGETQGHAVALEGESWGLKKGEGDLEKLPESWRVKTILWDLGDSEYAKTLDPQPSPPESATGRLELWSAEGILTAYSWEKAPASPSELRMLWIQKDGEVTAVQVEAEVLEKMEQGLEQIQQPEKGEPAPTP